MKRESRAPFIFAIVQLFLPVLYVGSYLALVKPWNRVETYADGEEHIVHYRISGTACWRFFRPIQLIDREIRTSYWQYLTGDPNRDNRP